MSQISADRLSFYGVLLGVMGYGVNLSVFLMTLLYLGRCERRGWADNLWILLGVVLFSANTASNVVHIRFCDTSFVEHSQVPGQSAAYYFDSGTLYMVPVHVAASTITLVLQDGLLVYRCWTIYSKAPLALILPGIVFLLALTSNIASLILVTVLGDTYWEHVRLNTALGFASLSCTIILTVAIVARLLRIRHTVRKTLKSSLVPYVSLSSILVESAFAYTAGTTAFLIAYYVESPVQLLLYPVAIQAQSLAPFLIILRMAESRARQTESEPEKTCRTLSITIPRALTVETTMNRV